ncbi:sigma-70 family RNA polymerase sigma factor [Luteolibacter pohnpeiensis]|uniref:Sigma-70 family RNA polymerase sigma factor n=1 Tax=Luteolibacter pohnpeiensis TaxID=454153 RepID=A0A934S3B5_9BACT|nr:sigma-70 family RNA polymerase sigma factor [Luteolibacter pohnpeiensis]MBK1882400.1 sigma-70 family RNA polymerase sigma factor [Luteolibacter pohnpeiensis]
MSEHLTDAGISRLTEHLFRHESGKLVSALTAIFGIRRLQLAEDVVQEAMIRALQTWPYHGVPENPAAWLMQTAKNRALDLIRREKRFYEKQPEIIASFERSRSDDPAEVEVRFDNEIGDHRLSLIFACCHPSIPSDAQIALALKTLCGFSPKEISRAFLATEAAVAKRLTRARQKIAEHAIGFEIPSGSMLSVRVDGVLQVLYFLFNEGYSASNGESVVKADLCREAIRLGLLLADHPLVGTPKVHALVSLMMLNAARLSAREDAGGNILRLREQDRSKWDIQLIHGGLRYLASSAVGKEMSEYHLQAGISACHCVAKDFESTDWVRILQHYDRWMELNDSPVIALNRTVAVANLHGPEHGLQALERILKFQSLENYYLYYAVRGDLQEQLGNDQSAESSFAKAEELTDVLSEKRFLQQRILNCRLKSRGIPNEVAGLRDRPM